MQQCHTGIKRHDEGSFRTTRNNAKPSNNSPGQIEIMAKLLQLAVWNANGLTQHKEELEMFLSIYDIDIMLISETHFTEKTSYEFTTTYSTTPTIRLTLLEEEQLFS
jgi:hypothetical protein